MIITKEIDKISSKKNIDLKCDYCQIEFQRQKSQVIRGRKIIQKDSCGAKKCISSKRKESNLKKYGFSNCSQNEFVKSKKEKTMLKKYGFKSPAKNKNVKEKIAQTNIKKYGNKCSLHDESSKIKTKKTCMEKYGCEHPFSSSKIREKIYLSMKLKYGDHFTKTEEYRNKTKKTCVEKYGVEHHLMSKDVQNKRKKTNIEKYGFEFPSQNSEVFKKIYNSKKNKKTIYGKTQEEIKNFIESVSGLIFSSELMDKKEIDIINRDINLAIEYCGLYWHNESSPEPRNKNYHYEKYKLCKSKKIRLLTIFEDEWVKRKEQCKNYISSVVGKFEKRIYARKCTIECVPNEVSNKFYSDFHIQGKPFNTFISFALKFKGEIVGCLSLGKHHRKSNEVIINRLCFKKETQIIGGSSKLFKHCFDWCKKNNIKEIKTWSDNRWSEGDVYLKNGFKLDKEIKPDYSYVDLKKRNTRLSKQSQKKSNNNCPKNLTEKEWCFENSMVRIWDCGKKRWIIKI